MVGDLLKVFYGILDDFVRLQIWQVSADSPA